MLKLFRFLALAAVAAPAWPQQTVRVWPDCIIFINLSAVGNSVNLQNQANGCDLWTFAYNAQGFATLSIEVQSAPNAAGDTPGAFVPFAGTVVSGTNPATAITQASSKLSGYFPWMRVRLTATTGGPGTISGVLYGFRTGSSTVTISGNVPVVGPDAPGAASTTNPVQMGANDGAVVRRVISDTSGRLIIVGSTADSSSTPATNPVLIGGTDGTAARMLRTASLSNFPTSVTLTGRNSVGAQLHEKGSRWSVVSNPAAGTQATASIAAEASVRHVADCISFSAGSTAAPALTAFTVALRDGATGAGTVIWTYEVIVSAATGQDVPPHSVCGLNLVGTTNTAMTLEFNAGLANLIQAVSLSGYNVN